ncbi:MAG: PilZ domain-containing protein [Deferrisomatales bacterium]
MNQRSRTRVESRKGVTVAWLDGSCTGELANISLKGCLVAAIVGGPPAAEQAVSVAIHLQPDAPELDVALHGRVVRHHEHGLAVDFTEVPAESFQHLLRLVQYNASDPDAIERELAVSAFGARPPA